MFSTFHFSRPFIISLWFLSLIGIASAAFFQFSGKSGTSHNYGVFLSSWSGNAGIISFDPGSPNCTSPDAGLDGENLIGSFCLQTLGRVTFDAGARIVPNPSGKVTDLWTVQGTASSSGGKIYFQSGSEYSVKYNPTTKKIVGNAWNYGIGVVPFWLDITEPTLVNTGTTSTGTTNTGTTSTGTTNTGTTNTGTTNTWVTNTGTTEWFEGRVKVLGNIWGNSTFDTFYSAGTKFNASLLNDTLNRIRKNVALITRNIPANLANNFGNTTPEALGNKIVYINTSSALQTLTYGAAMTSYFPSSADSLIIIGGDLIIDTDIINSSNLPKGIIVLKNEAWVGGNIIIRKDVKKIYSSIFAEWTLYSGDDKNTLYNADTLSAANLANVAPNQLHIYGVLMSRNTIWGASQGTAWLCVYGETTCSYSQAIRYDLNYFRWNPGTRTTTNRWFRDSTLDNFSLVIEADTRLTSNPPPGF